MSEARGEIDYEGAYALVKDANGDYQKILEAEAIPHDPRRVRRLCEMIFAREYDDWYWGDPAPNVSKAIHEHCRRLARQANRPLSSIRRVGALLAWAYVALDHDSDDAFLLLEHILLDAEERDGRIVPTELRGELESMLGKWRTDRGIPSSLEKLSPREREIWDEIARWGIQPKSIWEPVVERLEQARDWVADQMPDVMTRAITDAVQGALLGIQDAAEVLTRDKALLANVRKKGHSAESIRDLRRVPIDILDGVSAATMAGGKILAALEGAGAGAGGFVLLAADLPVLMALNLRFISQIAHTYGFETSAQEERTFVLNVLGAGSSDHAAKTAFLKDLNKLMLDVARGATWKELNEHAFVGMVRKVAAILGARLTKRKLAQLIPVVGGTVGAGANYAFTHQNLEAARMLYRKRYLIERCVAG